MEKRFKNGLCLGKFMPIHKGHKFLIDKAIELCETVHVMVCSIKNEPINGTDRYKWVKKLYENNKNVNIILCEDENPQYEDECESLDEFYSYWIKSVYSRIPKLDSVFTSEDYGDDFARYLSNDTNKVEHILVDKDRINFPVSGTKVRNDAFKVWNYMIPHVKPYYTRKISIIGPESTGKSTMVKKLSEHFNTNFVEEYGRTYTDNIPAISMGVKDYENIAIGHKLNIERSIKESNKFIFIDTEAITTKVFLEMYLGNDIKSDIIDNIILNQKIDKWFLLDIDVPWVDDGTRDFPKLEDRLKHFNKLKRYLDELNIEYQIVSGDYEERFNFIKNNLI